MKETILNQDPNLVSPTTYTTIIEKLRTEVQNKAAFAAVIHMFAQRQRARGRITLGALTQSMTKSDHNFSKEDYRAVLASLARFGIGKIDYDLKSNMRALKGIRFTLQSIGLAALGRTDSLELFGIRSYLTAQNEPVKKETVIPAAPPKKELQEVLTRPTITAVLRVTLEDKTQVDIPFPRMISSNEFTAYLQKIPKND